MRINMMAAALTARLIRSGDGACSSHFLVAQFSMRHNYRARCIGPPIRHMMPALKTAREGGSS